MGNWFAPLIQPSAQDAAAIAGMVEEAASHESKSFTVTRPAEWQLSVVDHRISMIQIFRQVNKSCETLGRGLGNNRDGNVCGDQLRASRRERRGE